MQDVNDTRYHLLLGRADWHRSQADEPDAAGRRWEYDDTQQSLQLQAEVLTLPPAYDLVLISLAAGQSLPTQGTQQVVIAQTDTATLHFRIFDAQGQRVVDQSESDLPATAAAALETLKTTLAPFWATVPPTVPIAQKPAIVGAVIALISIPQPERRDSDRDPYGHHYWIDESGTQIAVRWAAATTAETLWPLPNTDCLPPTPSAFRPARPSVPPTPEPLAGLAVLSEGYLVVGSPTTGSLLAFDLYALDSGYLRLPLAPGPTSDRPAPNDLAALPDGGLWVLDRTHHWVWRFDRYLRSRPLLPPELIPVTPFQPHGSQPRRQAVPTPTAPLALHPDTVDPVAIAPLPDGSFWLLDQPATGASRLWHYRADGTAAHTVELVTANLVETGADDLNLGLIRGYDLAYLPDRAAQGHFLSTGLLFIVEISGQQAFALRVVSLTPLVLRIQRQYYPLRHLGRVSLIADWSGGEVYYQQAERPTGAPPSDRWLPLKALPRRRFEPESRLILPTFDGREPNCVWHRLCVDACLPPETALRIETRAAEQPAQLPQEPWHPQPTLYRRPSTEVPYSALWSTEELADPHTSTWELLFQQMTGRYLQIRLTLVGNGRSSPRLRSLRAHYPRFSYLRQYLPQVYQQDPNSLDFLDRFLANPEGIFTLIEGLIAQVQTLLDVKTIPAEALEWLASWVGLALAPGWSDYQRRLLIAQAPYFFQRRGTTVGLLQAILLTLYPEFGPRIFQDNVAELCPTVRIVEQFLTRNLSGVAVGDPTETTTPSSEDTIAAAQLRAHRFTVMVPTTLTASTRALVERLVDLEKPAHTAFTLKQYWALFRVGEVRLGLDTVLGPGGQFETFRLGESALAEAALGNAFPYTLTNRTVISC